MPPHMASTVTERWNRGHAQKTLSCERPSCGRRIAWWSWADVAKAAEAAEGGRDDAPPSLWAAGWRWQGRRVPMNFMVTASGDLVVDVRCPCGWRRTYGAADLPGFFSMMDR